MIKLNEYALRLAIANNKLEGQNVTSEMIRNLEEALNNPNISKKDIVEYLLNKDKT